MQQPQIRLIAAINDTATLPSIQFGGSESNGSGTGIRGTISTMALSINGTDKLSISSSGLSLDAVPALPVQVKNTIFAGPASGSDAAPAFRAVVKADIDPVIKTFTSSAGAGGASTEAMTVTGLLSTDTILAVSQSVPGANSLPLLGFNTLADDALTGVWSADPGAGAVIVVTVMR